jgi:hypothetical protein
MDDYEHTRNKNKKTTQEKLQNCDKKYQLMKKNINSYRLALLYEPFSETKIYGGCIEGFIRLVYRNLGNDIVNIIIDYYLSDENNKIIKK